MKVTINGQPRTLFGQGNGPIDAACHALPGPWRIRQYEEHALGQGSDAQAIAFIQLEQHPCRPRSGVGIHEDIITASLHALMAAINRCLAEWSPADRRTLFLD
ncbi:MAG: hypothetical protein HQL76_03970 [Magnetococcales bacterium]|nr:hypothetical protein [Magnetococcales bacterium]